MGPAVLTTLKPLASASAIAGPRHVAHSQRLIPSRHLLSMKNAHNASAAEQTSLKIMHCVSYGSALPFLLELKWRLSGSLLYQLIVWQS